MFLNKRITVTTVFFLVFYLFAIFTVPVATSAQKEGFYYGGGGADGIGCQKVWGEQSENNDIMTCLMNIERIKAHWLQFIYPAFCALLLVVTLLSFPFLFCKVAFCRGRSVKTPKDDAARLWIWMWIAYSIFWSCAVALFIMCGIYVFSTVIPDTLDTLNNTLSRFTDTNEKIVDFTSDWSTGERRAMPEFNLNISFVSDILYNASNILDDVKENYENNTSLSYVITTFVSVIALVTSFFITFFFYCGCGLPRMSLCVSCFYWLLGILFSTIGLGMLLATYVLSASCVEIDLQHKRLPGVFQWFVKPHCDKLFNFDDIRTGLDNGIANFSQKGCEELLNNCDNNEQSRNKVLKCDVSIIPPEGCNNFNNLLYFADKVRVKPIVDVCPEKGTSCTLLECAADCTAGEAKNLANDVLKVIDKLQNATIAISYAKPLFDCNFIIDNVINSFLKCNDMWEGALITGTGFFVGGLTFGLGIYILLRGTCVWTRKSEKDRNANNCGR